MASKLTPEKVILSSVRKKLATQYNEIEEIFERLNLYDNIYQKESDNILLMLLEIIEYTDTVIKKEDDK